MGTLHIYNMPRDFEDREGRMMGIVIETQNFMNQWTARADYKFQYGVFVFHCGDPLPAEDHSGQDLKVGQLVEVQMAHLTVDLDEDGEDDWDTKEYVTIESVL